MTRALLLASTLLLAPLALSAKIVREIEHDFPIVPGDEIVVEIRGGPIQVKEGGSDSAAITLKQTFRADSDAEADAILQDFEILFEKRDGKVFLVVENRKSGWLSKGNNRAQFAVSIRCPAHTHLELDTSGGPITVEGDFSGEIEADTSGGAITIDGGARKLELDTSGGAISVGYGLDVIEADTSGGSIKIGYVAPEARKVEADTSGGSISIGLDPTGRYSVTADTSGGSVKFDDLPFTATKQSRTHATGTINGGGTEVRADTSGGGITIHAARRP